MFASAECSEGYRFPKSIISYAVYLYHRFLLSYRDVQKLLFERRIEVSYETIRVWCAKFGPELARALRYRKPRRGQSWHLDEMRVIVGGVTHWLWRAVNEHGDVIRGLERAKPGPLALVRCSERTVMPAQPGAFPGG